MKWQIITNHDLQCSTKDSITIRNYKWLSRFGAKLHSRPEIDGWEFRLAYFSIAYSRAPCQESRGIKIPIPFMKLDRSFLFRFQKENAVADKTSEYH